MEKAAPPAALTVAQREALDPRSVLVRCGQAPVMRLWFRREIPVRASAEQFKKGVTYRHIPEGTWIGVVDLPRTFTDYRKQRIAPGVYTLRLALQPETGEHTDTSPHPEFLLLSPAARDNSTAKVAPAELIELSREVIQGRHPAVLLLWPIDRPDGVRVLDKGKGVLAVTCVRPIAAEGRKGRLAFGITVAGFWSQ